MGTQYERTVEMIHYVRWISGSKNRDPRRSRRERVQCVGHIEVQDN